MKSDNWYGAERVVNGRIIPIFKTEDLEVFEKFCEQYCELLYGTSTASGSAEQTAAT